ncbi:MAG: TolC family protein [Bacteroidia bacterium]|nr:TolC family protein [Bacteroidia bacterium]
MKYLINIAVLVLGLGMANGLQAQEVLSLEDAIKEALNNNYGIKLSRLNVEQSENSAHIGATGALPSVTLNGGSNVGYTRNTSITLNQRNEMTGEPTTEINGNDIATYGFNASLGVNYTLGLGSFTNFKVLNTSVSQSKENLHLTLEQTSAQVSNAYFALARLVDSYELQKESLQKSKDRLAYVQNQAEFGQANGVAVLNAQVDINTDSINIAQTLAGIANARRDLNYLMGRDVENEFTVNTEVEPLQMMSLANFQDKALAQNSSLVIADYSRKIANLNLKAARQSAYPTLTINGSYAYNFADNGPVSVLTQQSSDGLTLTGGIAIPLFNGNQIRRNVQNAEIAIANSQSTYKQAEQQVLRDVNKAYADYMNARKVLDLNQKSLEAAQANFLRTKELFELGQANSVLFREAQLNLLRVKYNLRSLLYDIKVSEIQLLQLSGLLVEKQ